MNAQYLDAHKFIATLHEQGVDCTETVVNLMKYAVIEDVAPVRHAHWVAHRYTGGLFYRCSNCRNDGSGMYCSNCGAKMDGGE